MTPPDGSQPRMRMYVWDTATVSTRHPLSDDDASILMPILANSPSETATSKPVSSFTSTVTVSPLV